MHNPADGARYRADGEGDPEPMRFADLQSQHLNDTGRSTVRTRRGGRVGDTVLVSRNPEREYPRPENL